MTDRYCVIGNPVAHSRSPAIHARFAAQCHQVLSYEAILVPLDGFGPAARSIPAGEEAEDPEVSIHRSPQGAIVGVT